ncbi:MAG: acetylxylan esterase [Sedimentisphaerales bacterium]
MAVVDMPLEELKLYKGKNPRPADFDKYWEKALAEMNSVNPKPAITKADFKCSFADCFDMYFTGVNNAKIYAKLLKPKNKTKCPAVLCFHGYTGASSQWVDYLAYAAQGFVVAALDCRGQAGKSQDTTQITGTTSHGHIIRGLDDSPEKLAFRQIFLDTAMLAKIVAGLDEVDEKRMAAMGGSQGGGLTLACAALVPGIKKAAPMYPFLCDYKRVWEMDLGTGAYIELKNYFRWFDPQHKNEDQIFNKLGYIDIQHLAKRIKAEILIGVGLRDDICPPSTQFAAYNKMKCKKQMLIYPDFGHEGLPGFNDIAFQWLSKI